MQVVLTRIRALHPTRRAVALMLTAVVCFSVLETTGKYLTHYYPVIELVWARYTVHAMLMVLLLAPRVGWVMVKHHPTRRSDSTCWLLMGSTLCNFTALSFLPLAEVKALSFVSPLLWSPCSRSGCSKKR